jgi:hypothetical protein
MRRRLFVLPSVFSIGEPRTSGPQRFARRRHRLPSISSPFWLAGAGNRSGRVPRCRSAGTDAAGIDGGLSSGETAAMAILLSYNFSGAQPINNNHLQSMLERFGWQSVGGSSYRYPPIDKEPLFPEDWFNAVVPALMCFRAYVLKLGLTLSHFSLDAHSSTGYSQTSTQVPPASGNSVVLTKDNVNQQFGEKNLRDWLDAVTNAIPY